jgi:hypothetical protein
VTLKFDYPIDFKGPDNLSKAATVNLFVWNNYMHDISYAYGFDEIMEISRIDYGRFDELTAEDPFKSWNDDEVLLRLKMDRDLTMQILPLC